MGFSNNRVKGLYMAAVIHDIGKIYVPAEMLSKPSKLSELEFNIIKCHTKVGYDILHTIEFPWPIAQTVLQHHERMNGSGYPEGLSGEEILVEYDQPPLLEKKPGCPEPWPGLCRPCGVQRFRSEPF